MWLLRGTTRDERTRAEARARLSAGLRTLDAHSFWVVPADTPTDAVVVTGTTGVFLVMPCGEAGALTVSPGGTKLGGQPVPGVRALRKGARELRRRMVTANVPSDVTPIVCITHGLAGSPQTVRGVRYAHVKDVARDVAARSAVLTRDRAQRAARTLGVRIAGDQKRHFYAR